MDWEKLKFFYEVAKYDNISQAAENINITPSSLSRSIIALEEQFGTKLFFRTNSGLEKTEQGFHLYNIVKRMNNYSEEAAEIYSQDHCSRAGQLKVTMSCSIASLWFPHYVSDFLKKYPEISVEICTTKNYIDPSRNYILQSSFDAAICAFIPNNQELTQHYLFTFRPRFYASKQYLKKFGTPNSLEDLDNHRIILHYLDAPYTGCGVNWILGVGRKDPTHPRKAYISVNSTYATAQLAINGCGIIAISNEYPFVEHSELINILHNVISPGTKIYFTYEKSSENILRITALRDYLKEVTKKYRK